MMKTMGQMEQRLDKVARQGKGGRSRRTWWCLHSQLVSATQLEQSILTKKDQNCAQSKLQIN